MLPILLKKLFHYMPFCLNFAFHVCEIDGKGEVFCIFLQFSLLICDIAESFASLHSTLSPSSRDKPGAFWIDKFNLTPTASTKATKYWTLYSGVGCVSGAGTPMWAWNGRGCSLENLNLTPTNLVAAQAFLSPYRTRPPRQYAFFLFLHV